MIVELSCDHDGCDVAYAPTIPEMTSIKDTRIGSMVAGWTRVGAQDYCPEHPQTTRIDAIRALAGKGRTDDQIAGELDLSRNTVLKLRRGAGIPAGIGRVGRPSHGFRAVTR